MTRQIDPSTLSPLFEVGRGGVAVVRAELWTDENGYERVVAVKRLLSMVTEHDESRTMFLNEARLASWIEHPNVVEILGFGLGDDPFIVMEWIPGVTLAALMRRATERSERPISPALSILITMQLANALHAAHELLDPATGRPLELVHRDVSPQNVLLGFNGTVRLTDFGIAKALGYGARTRTGDVKGKVPYMAPEQALGDDVDRRADLFALASVWFETVSGQRRLGSGNEIDMLRSLAMSTLPSLREAWPEAPDHAVELFASMTERDASRRIPTAIAVAQGLRPLLGGSDAAALQRELASRIQLLFPGHEEGLATRIRVAKEESRRNAPYRKEIEAFVGRPSVLFRERRRARFTLGLGIAFLGIAILFIVALVARSRPGAVTPISPTSHLDATSRATASAEDIPLLPGERTTQGNDSPMTTATAASASVKAKPPVPATPVRSARPQPRPTKDGLDETPF